MGFVVSSCVVQLSVVSTSSLISGALTSNSSILNLRDTVEYNDRASNEWCEWLEYLYCLYECLLQSDIVDTHRSWVLSQSEEHCNIFISIHLLLSDISYFLLVNVKREVVENARTGIRK